MILYNVTRIVLFFSELVMYFNGKSLTRFTELFRTILMKHFLIRRFKLYKSV